METLQSAIDALRKNCYFGSVDLSEAFYSIPIREENISDSYITIKISVHGINHGSDSLTSSVHKNFETRAPFH